MANEPASDPIQQLMALSQAHLAGGALKAALEMEVFTHIVNGNNTVEKLAAAKQASVRGMRLLCDALVSLSLIDRNGDTLSVSEPIAKLLVKGSPTYMGSQIAINNAPWFWEGAAHLAEIVKVGHPLVKRSAEAKELPFWEEFERNSRQMATRAGTLLADIIGAEIGAGAAPRQVLDIACGSGMFGFSVLKRFPEARLVSIDYANVLQLTEQDAQRLGLRERCDFRPGDLFADDLGNGYDLVIAANIMQIYGPERVVELAKRLYAAMAPGGLLVVHGPIPDEERRQNRMGLMFGLFMLIFTHEGDTYSFSDYQRMLEAAGFHDLALKESPSPRSIQAVIARK